MILKYDQLERSSFKFDCFRYIPPSNNFAGSAKFQLVFDLPRRDTITSREDCYLEFEFFVTFEKKIYLEPITWNSS